MNPFRSKADSYRATYNRLSAPTAHESAMASSFPLGGGYGRSGGERRIGARITRATKAIDALRNAEHYEALAAAFDAGRVNAQGRRINAASKARSEKREAYQQSREERITAARAEREGKEAWEVTAEVYAASAGILGGAPLAFARHEHAEKVREALEAGKPVPEHVR